MLDINVDTLYVQLKNFAQILVCMLWTEKPLNARNKEIRLFLSKAHQTHTHTHTEYWCDGELIGELVIISMLVNKKQPSFSAMAQACKPLVTTHTIAHTHTHTHTHTHIHTHTHLTPI